MVLELCERSLLEEKSRTQMFEVDGWIIPRMGENNGITDIFDFK